MSGTAARLFYGEPQRVSSRAWATIQKDDLSRMCQNGEGNE